MKQQFLKIFPFLVITLGAIGLIDSIYLTYEHYQQSNVGCLLFGGCNEVLRSQYAEIAGIPMALLGVIYYSTILLVSTLILVKRTNLINLLVFLTFFGFSFSMWLLYLQLFVIGSLCIYCTTSALISTSIFIIVLFQYRKVRLQDKIEQTTP